MLGRNVSRSSSSLVVLSHWLEIFQEEPHICSKAVVATESTATKGCQQSAHLASSFLKGNPNGIFQVATFYHLLIVVLNYYLCLLFNLPGAVG